MSKELERIKKSHFTAMACLGVKENDKETEQAIEIVEKREKALEIIIEKDVNLVDIRCCDTVEQYNVKENGNIPLTQEEFNLLQEVLKRWM